MGVKCRYTPRYNPLCSHSLKLMPSAPSKRPPSQETSQEAFEEGLRDHLADQTGAQKSSRPSVPAADRVRSGLAPSVLSDIKEIVGLGWEDLEGVLGVSARTLQRRRERSENLTPAESDRLWRLLHIWHRATEALGSEDAARRWLAAPHDLLGGDSPLERLDTEPGLREVEDMLTVIDETGAA